MNSQSKIKTLRKFRGLTQAHCAQQAGFKTVGAWCHLEKGFWNPKLTEVRRKIATILGCSVEEIWPTEKETDEG